MTMSLLGFAAHLGATHHHLQLHREHAMERSAELVRDRAKEVIGTYDLDWEQLSAATIEKKGADTPLLETGEMRDSIEMEIKHSNLESSADIGTNNDHAAFQEFGTAKIPPRPFMGGTLAEQEEKIEHFFHGVFEKTFPGSR